MGKLQIIKKPNDRVIYMSYLPVTTIEELGWVKGDELDFEIVDEKLVLKKVN